MAYRTFYCAGLGFYVEKQGRVIAAAWTDEKFVAEPPRHWYSIDEPAFRKRMESEGFFAGDEEAYFEDPSGSLV